MKTLLINIISTFVLLKNILKYSFCVNIILSIVTHLIIHNFTTHLIAFGRFSNAKKI